LKEKEQITFKHILLSNISPKLHEVNPELIEWLPISSPLDTINLIKVNSLYGWRIHPVLGVILFHNGIDLASQKGIPVIATANGFIEKVKNEKYGYGNYVLIDHTNGYKTRYAHLTSMCVHPGQFVTVGDTIGITGDTGLTTGPHLHYEIISNGRPIDPIKFVTDNKKEYITILKKIQAHINEFA